MVVVVGLALVAVGAVVGALAIRTELLAVGRTVAQAAFHHWPVTLIVIGAAMAIGTGFRRELDPRTSLRVRAGLLVVLGLAVVLGMLALLLGPITTWVAGDRVVALRGKDAADAVNAVRQTLLATAAGLAAVVGLAFTARTFYLSRRGQVTDRYTRLS
jgi:hypothetical protein